MWQGRICDKLAAKFGRPSRRQLVRHESIAGFRVSPPGPGIPDDVLECPNIRDKLEPRTSTLQVHNNYGGGFANDGDRVALSSIRYYSPNSAGNSCQAFVRHVDSSTILRDNGDGPSLFDETEEDEVCIPLPVWAERAGAREVIYHNPMQSKAAIVTCGGLCPGLNDVIQGIVNKLQDYGVKEENILGIRYGFRGFYSRENPPKKLSKRSVDGIHLEGGTILGTSRGKADMERLLKVIDMQGIDMVFVIGGNGGNAGASSLDKLCRENGVVCSVIGVPKSIDNDILLIDKCFGFDTAVEESQRALLAAKVEASSACFGIGLVKLMGRESGFIAMEASLASGVVDVCLIPEVDFVLEGESGLFNYIEKLLQSKGHCVLCAAEGTGQRLMTPEALGTDESGNPRLQDIGTYLRDRLKDRFPYSDMKYIDPTYMIRAIPCTSTDRIYCKVLASNAVHAAFAGFTGVTVGRVNTHYVNLPTDVIIQAPRKVDPKGKMWNRLRAAINQPNFGTVRSQRSQEEFRQFVSAQGSFHVRNA